MRPIRFSCAETLQMPPEEIAGRILNLANWTSFKGYAVLPGIKLAEYEVRTPGVIGSRIRVTNTDGSSHVEEVIEWQPNRLVRLRMNEFTRPLALLASEFVESWELQRVDNVAIATRSFEIYPKSIFARPLLWLIARLLRRAIARHLRGMREFGRSSAESHLNGK